MSSFFLTLIIIIPFFLNDFIFIGIKNLELSLVIDYFWRILLLSFIFKKIGHSFSAKNIGLIKIRFDLFLGLTLLLVLVGFLMEEALRPGLNNHFPWGKLYQVGLSSTPMLKIIDATIGFFILSLSQELAFRGYLPFLWRKLNPNYCYIISALIFSLAHWGLGLPQMILSFFWAIILHLTRHFFQSIYPGIAASFFLNILRISPFLFFG